MGGALWLAGACGAAALALGVWFALAAWRRTLDERLGASQAELRRLADGAASRDRDAGAVERQMSGVREALQQLMIREEERRAREERGWETLHHVSTVLAGGQRTGQAGESVLRESLASLPSSLVIRDYQVNGKVVEFGLVLPDGRRLPVDSKWTAERELAALAETTDPSERQRLTRAVEAAVANRAREVATYLDPALTAPLGVAAVPDGAYAVLRRAHAEAYRRGVVVVPYSMTLPVLLFLYGLVARFGGAADVQACLADLSGILEAVETTVENKLARAATMLSNGTDELRGQIGRARGVLARARPGDGEDEGPSADDREPARPGLAAVRP